MKDCIFCKIASGEAPAEVVAENERAIAIVNIKPAAETHILVIPKKHIETFMDLKFSDDLKAMLELAQEIVVNRRIGKGYKLIFNGGDYQAIDHVHWHILSGKMKSDGT